MKRRVLTIFLFLFFGAIVNVAVAWGITAAVDFDGLSLRWNIREVRWPYPVPVHWPEYANALEFGTIGWGWIRYEATAVEDRGDAGFWATETFFIWIVKAGWPIRCWQYETWCDWVHPTGTGDAGYYRFDGQPQPTYWSYGLPLEFDRFGFEPRCGKRLPVHLIWPGFAVNTVFYALILWLLIPGPFVLRRIIRRKRGRCPKCGYDLRGDLSGGCPECAWGRESTA